MFDYIDFKCDCPTCGAEVRGFQSKDGSYLMLTIKPWEVCRFYSYCNKCDTRIEYSRGGEPPVLNKLLVEAITLLDTGGIVSPKVVAFLDKTRKYISDNNAWLEEFELEIETKEEAEARWKKS